jgi:hypothetical protein
LESDRDLEAFPSAIGKDGYPATVGAASRRENFGNRSVVMTAIVKVLPEPRSDFSLPLRVFLRRIE